MKCFIFTNNPPYDLPPLCGTESHVDLVEHLRRTGVEKIYSHNLIPCEGVFNMPFSQAAPDLGNDWIAVYPGMITRQNPMELRERGLWAEASSAVSLACSGKPWEHTTVLTDADGRITSIEINPSPENSKTNLCFSGLVWVGSGNFNPDKPVDEKLSSAFLLPGYWRNLNGRENYLLTVFDLLTGCIQPWPHMKLPDSGVVMKSRLPDSCTVKGILWLGAGCSIGEDCELENCVILDGAVIGKGVQLRNCFINKGSTVEDGIVRNDKYLTMLGDDNG